MLTPEYRASVLDGTATGTPLKTLGLRGRGEVFIGEGQCVRLIDRASRFLRKDAEGFMTVLSAASEAAGTPLAGHVLIRRAPVCSKARRWLNEQGVSIEAIETK